MDSKQKILLCAPDFYEVDYVINPWMEGNIGNTSLTIAQRQWAGLRDVLARHTNLSFLPPVRGVPDMVFTANAGFVLDNKVVVSRFKSAERQREEPHFHAWFSQNAFDIMPWPQDVSFEGAGDALIDRVSGAIWAGYGFRSDARAPAMLGQIYNRKVIPIKLVDNRFYHLDTCLCPLSGGFLLYFPPAFDADSNRLIEENVPADKRIAIDEGDAAHFACNAVDIDGHIILNRASDDLKAKLNQAGFKVVEVALTEFLKAGGTAKCLTLKLVEG